MSRKFHILITEDEPRMRTLLAEYLIEKGYEIFTAEKGLEGLRILEDQDIDLVITDYKMPCLDGREFIFRIKKVRPLLPVILVSGLSRKGNPEIRSVQGFLQAFFEKPVPLALLYAAVQKAQKEAGHE